jgi:hypothetical protein
MRYEKLQGTNFENISTPTATAITIFYRAAKIGSLNKNKKTQQDTS